MSDLVERLNAIDAELVYCSPEGSHRTHEIGKDCHEAAAEILRLRTALAADADVSALFTVGGTTTAISLTRKTSTTGGVTYYVDNDATLNISLDNGTCTGITTAATSANTTAGIATSGAILSDFGVDLEGDALVTIVTMKSILIENLGTANVTVAGSGTDSFTIADDSFMMISGNSPVVVDGTLTFTSAGYADVRVTVTGVSS